MPMRWELFSLRDVSLFFILSSIFCCRNDCRFKLVKSQEANKLYFRDPSIIYFSLVIISFCFSWLHGFDHDGVDWGLHKKSENVPFSSLSCPLMVLKWLSWYPMEDNFIRLPIRLGTGHRRQIICILCMKY